MLKKLFVVTILSIGLAGCSGNYAVHPDKPSFSEVAKDPQAARQYLDEVNATITVVARAVLDAKKAGYITVDNAADMYAKLVEAAHYMDQAEGFLGLGDLASANDQVSQAEKLLGVVQEVVNKFIK